MLLRTFNDPVVKNKYGWRYTKGLSGCNKKSTKKVIPGQNFLRSELKVSYFSTQAQCCLLTESRGNLLQLWSGECLKFVESVSIF